MKLFTSPSLRVALVVLLLAAGSMSGCRGGDEANVFVTLKLAAPALQGNVVALRLNVAAAAKVYSETYEGPMRLPIVFPTTFSFSLPKAGRDGVDIEILALDMAERTVATAEAKGLTVRAGRTVRIEAFLRCLGGCPAPLADAGSPADGPTLPNEAVCGNGRVDLGETCDLAIAAGLPGACPSNDCNDGLSCTKDIKMGSGCAAACVHQEITDFRPGDGCCPTNGTHQLDEDCSATCGNGVVDPQEACDTAMASSAPGACPTPASCGDLDMCTFDRLISASTCAARCAHQIVTGIVSGDGCCPSLAATGIDADCAVSCGNGIKEPGEVCDVGIATGRADACPRACDDGKTCTTDTLIGAGCQASCAFAPVADLLAGDGCCPPGATALADPDCAATCGDGLVEPGETCDKGRPAAQPGGCPAACPQPADACLLAQLVGTADSCKAVCEVRQIATCKAAGDGCCPAGCQGSEDPDCSGSCGNGVVDAGERCDTARPNSTEGSCPSTCNDQNPCTDDLLLAGGTCHARCVHLPVTSFRAGDMCCPPGANRAVDADCAPTCGNGIVELPRETCDKAIAAGKPGACPGVCPAPEKGCSTYRASGSAEACTQRCEAVAVTSCIANDGCCPSGCTPSEDTDCGAVCGNGRLDAGEACDRAITAGNPGACPASCDDGISCTLDLPTGSVENCSRRCTSNRITACAGGDGCCPVGCSFATDPDCAPICGNSLLEDGETCDPPASCPTSCKDDNDICTNAKLVGDPSTCTARCTHLPIRECSAMSDKCCPSNCSSSPADADCRPSSAAMSGTL